MLSEKSVLSALNIAEELDKREIIVTPVLGSPLESLVQVSDLTDIKVDGNIPLEYTPDVAQLVTNSSNERHSTELNAQVEFLVPRIADHLNFTRNVVKPAIEQLAEELTKLFSEADYSNKTDMNIIIYDLPDPMYEVSLEQEIFKFDKLPNIPIISSLNYNGPNLSGQQIVELIKTGNGVIDAAITTWTIKLGYEYFANLFESLVNSAATPIQNYLEKDVNANLFVFLFSTRMLVNPIEGFNYTLNEFNIKMAELRNQAAMKLIYAYQTNRSNIGSGLLIKEYIGGNDIVVVGDVYRSWIENGGTNAALFGATLFDSPKVYLNDINPEIASLSDRWTSNIRLKLATLKSKAFLAKKQALSDSLDNLVNYNFDKFYNHLTPEGTGATRDLPEYNGYVTRFESLLESLKESDLINVWDISTRAICDCVFYYTSSKDLLTGINEHMKNNPELTAREAAFLSMVDYVINFLRQQQVVQY